VLPVIGLIAIASGLATQVIKVIIASVRLGQPDFSLLLTTGGMPSSHTATVTTLAILVGRHQGVASPLFSVTVIVGLYVIFEATGLRQEVGKQARILNEMIDSLLTSHRLDRRRLRELTGHTWSEVVGGFLCGIAGAIVAILLGA
jgi:acid phosphatase family membrane protein YuiD